MRIGLLIYGSLETLSGGYLYDRQLVRYLRSKGDQVEVISIPWRNYPQHLTDNFSRSLYQKLRDLPLDILLQDELNHPSLFQLNRRLKRQVDFNIVSVVHHLRCSEHRSKWQNQFYRLVERRYLESVDGFIFNSHSTREVVEELIGEKTDCVVAFPAGDRLRPEFSASQISARSKQKGPLRLLFLGNVIPRKGLSLLLEALAQIPGHQWRLSVVGSLEMDRDYVNRIRRQMKDNDIVDGIEFFGPLDENDLIEVMENSHMMVIPSSYEGFGIAYLEGMGFGLPAIASTAGGATEIITQGVDGFLILPGDSTLLRDLLSQVIEDRELLERMSQAALERFQSYPTWEDSISKIRNFLENMLKQKIIT